jgi:methionyl-tRNA formyltransferase
MPPRKLRIAFMGTPDFAAVALKSLIATGHHIACVYSQPPRPAGRGHKPTPSPVEALAREATLVVRTPTHLVGELEQTEFRRLDLDLAIVAAYGLILPRAILDAPRLGCVNIHASLLPRWRGAAPIQRAILAGDRETGVTIMQMEAGLDTGPMLKVAKLPIGPLTTGGELHDRLAELGAKLMVEALPGIIDGTLTPVTQPAKGVTYAHKIAREETRIDWTKPAAEIERQVRAFAPKPGAYAELGGERIKILAAEAGTKQGQPGTVLDEYLTIACGEGALRPMLLQRPGRGPLPASELLRGFAVPAGTRFTL